MNEHYYNFVMSSDETVALIIRHFTGNLPLEYGKLDYNSSSISINKPLKKQNPMPLTGEHTDDVAQHISISLKL
jgi:hypothetical protein